MKTLSNYLLKPVIALGLSCVFVLSEGFGTNAQAQDAADTSSFAKLLEKLNKEKAETEKIKQDAIVADFDFPVPPIKPYLSPMPWAAGESIFLETNDDGSVRHTISEFTCPNNIAKAPLRKASLQNENGATVYCDYYNEDNRFTLVIDGIGGRSVDLDALVKPIVDKAGGKPEIKSSKLSIGKTSVDCLQAATLDPENLDVSITVCHYEAYVVKLLSLGLSVKKSEKTFKNLVKNQAKFVKTRELCKAHIEDINNMKPSSATGRPLLATSVMYEQKGPTCFFTAMLSPNSKEGFNQVVYTFPENPDTPLMMTLHRNDGRLIKTFRLQHAFARETDRDEKQAVYNLIKTDPDGTYTVYDVAYTRVLPIQRFFSEAIKADTGKIKEKLGLKRNAAGGFDMIMK